MTDRRGDQGLGQFGSRSMAVTPRILVMACDGEYAMPLATALRSVAESNRRRLPIDVYVLFHHFATSQQQKVADSIPQDAGLTIHWTPVDLAAFDGCSSYLGYSKSTYSRLLIPDVFAKDVSKVLYLDSDVLVLDDLGPLWDTDLAGCPLGAVRDSLDSMIKADKGKSENLPQVAHYFNSGVLLIDIERWRSERVSERVIAHLEKHPTTRFPDQDALNIVCDGRWRELDPRWNFQRHREVFLEDLRSEDKPGIVHFVTIFKPWDFAHASPNASFYDRFRNRTLFRRGGLLKWRDFFRGGVPKAAMRARYYLRQHRAARSLWRTIASLTARKHNTNLSHVAGE